MWLTMRSIRSAGLVGRRGPHRAFAAALQQQALREVVAHGAVGRMHREQHAVEDGEADRAGVDRGQRPARRRRLCCAYRRRASASLPVPTASRRKTSRSYQDVVSKLDGSCWFSRSDTCRSTSWPPFQACRWSWMRGAWSSNSRRALPIHRKPAAGSAAGRSSSSTKCSALTWKTRMRAAFRPCAAAGRRRARSSSARRRHRRA